MIDIKKLRDSIDGLAVNLSLNITTESEQEYEVSVATYNNGEVVGYVCNELFGNVFFDSASEMAIELCHCLEKEVGDPIASIDEIVSSIIIHPEDLN